MLNNKSQNYYVILGVDENATLEQIKRAYKLKSMTAHPDKGGSAEEMSELNEAYQNLIDPLKRQEYDASLRNSPDAIDKMLNERVTREYLNSTGERYSKRYRDQFAELSRKYRANPIARQPQGQHITPYQSKLFDISHFEDKTGHLFQYVQSRNKNPSATNINHLTSIPLTAEIAFSLFTDFIEGKYYRNEIILLKEYYIHYANYAETREKNLYLSMSKVFEISCSQPINGAAETYKALQGINDYIKRTASFSMRYTAMLLQNEYYRDLFKWSFVNACHSSQGVIPLSNTLSDFINYPKAREELTRILDAQHRLATKDDASEDKHQLESLVKFYKYIYIYEKSAKEHAEAPQMLKQAQHHIEYAYEIIDWMPALRGLAPLSIMSHLLLQAGAHFQAASHLDTNEDYIMACEHMAYRLFMEAIYISHRATLDVEYYILLQTINSISQFNYKIEHLDKTIPALQERFLFIANVFPLAEKAHSNIDMIDRTMGMQSLMRRLLHTLMDIIKNNFKNDAVHQIIIDHQYVNVLYYAYEACLRQWYEEENIDPNEEEKIRKALLLELIKINNWSIQDLNENLLAPWVMINRNSQNWLQPSRTLALPKMESQAAYCSLDAVQVNYETGEIIFAMRDISGIEPPSERVVTLSDLQELLQHNITHGFISLDEVDHNMHFHPFNKIRLGPPSLFKTDFLKTLLLTDYFLKFITVGQEVNGAFPYKMRPIDHMIAHLPFHLKKIIRDFHEAQTEESAHRFWIEANPVNVFMPRVNEEQPADLIQFLIPEVKMVVKKHLMRRDESGALIDDENELNEGWQIYLLPTLPSNANLTSLGAEHPAMVFIRNKNECYFVQPQQNPEKITLGTQHAYLILQLLRFSVNAKGLIVKNDENNAFLYHFIKTLTEEYKKPHYFSPEYVFAQEFTAHYDEFGLYFPEFSRLRELSRITVFIRLLNNLKENNQENIKSLQTKLHDVAHWQDREAKMAKAIAQINEENLKKYQEVFNRNSIQIRRIFETHRNNCSLHALYTKHKIHLDNMRLKIGTLDFNSNSREVLDACEEMIEHNRQVIINQHGRQAWNYNEANIRQQCQNERANIAARYSKQKRENCQKQMFELYYPELSSILNRNQLEQQINAFLNGDSSGLANQLAKKEYDEALTQLTDSIGVARREVIERAVQGIESDIRNIITKLTTDQLTHYTEQVEADVKKIKAIVPEEKQDLRDLITKYQKIERELTKIGIGVKDNQNEDVLQGKCLWVPASIDRHSNHMRLVYGGVSIQPNLNVNRVYNQQSQSVMNSCLNPSNHVAVTYNNLPSATSTPYSNSFYLRAQENYQPQASGPSGPSSTPPSFGGGNYGGHFGGGGGGRSGGGNYPPPPPNPPQNISINDFEKTHGPTKSKRAMHTLIKDVRENGVQEPIKYVVHEGTKYVVDGHHRLLAAAHAKLGTVPAQEVKLPYLGYKTEKDLTYTY